MNNKRIILNQIKTPDGTILRSMSRHDFVTYIDQNGLEYMVDGGVDYLRRNSHDDAPYTEMTVFEDAPFDVIRESFHRGGRGKDGTEPLTWVPLKDMNEEWLEACIQYNESMWMGDSLANELYHKELAFRRDNNIVIKE